MEKHTVSALIVAGGTVLAGVFQAVVLTYAKKQKKAKAEQEAAEKAAAEKKKSRI